MEETKVTFEEAIGQLADIVKKMEQGETPLDESLRLFEQGVHLTKVCNDLLDGAQQKVEVLMKREQKD